MAKTNSAQKSSAKWLYRSATALSLLWAGFWIWFGVASGISEQPGDAVYALIHSSPGLVFLASALIAMRLRLLGGILLWVWGFLIAVGYPLFASGKFPPITIFFVVLTGAFPPLISSILFIASGIKHRTK